jgi:hypothetical protein
MGTDAGTQTSARQVLAGRTDRAYHVTVPVPSLR